MERQHINAVYSSPWVECLPLDTTWNVDGPEKRRGSRSKKSATISAIASGQSSRFDAPSLFPGLDIGYFKTRLERATSLMGVIFDQDATSYTKVFL